MGLQAQEAEVPKINKNSFRLVSCLPRGGFIHCGVFLCVLICENASIGQNQWALVSLTLIDLLIGVLLPSA